MEAGSSLGLSARRDAAADRGAAGDARDPAAADQPVSQPHQELVAGGRDRLSRPGLGVRRHDAEPDRAGDRDHRDHHGRLSPDFAGHQRDHELLRMAARTGASAHERDGERTLDPGLCPPGTGSRARRADQDHRLCRIPAHPAVQLADQHPAHHRRRPAAVVHHRSRGEIPAGRCGLDRQGPHRLPRGERRTHGRRLLAVRAGEVQPVHLRLLSGGRALAGQPDLRARRVAAVAAADSAAAGQGPQCRPVLRRASRRRILPAAWRRIERFRRQLDRRAAVGVQRQHRRRRRQARDFQPDHRR